VGGFRIFRQLVFWPDVRRRKLQAMSNPFRRPKAWVMAAPPLEVRIPDKFTRQRTHAADRRRHFTEMSRKFAGELRRVRRAMAFALWRREKNLRKKEDAA
jgi:hypothetical protein